MDRKQIINCRQFSWLTASLLSGGGLVSVQQALIKINSRDAWMSYILPTLYVIALSYVFYQMVRRFPGKNMFEITKILFGNIMGTIINLILIFHLWFILVRDLSSFGKFAGIILLPNTPDEIIITLLIIMLLYYGKTSVEVVARVNDLVFPIFVVIILSLPLLLANEIDKNMLQPVITGSLKNFLSGNAVTAGWYGDIFVMGAFLHTLWETKQVQASLRHGIFLSTMLISLFLVLDVLVLGPDIPGNYLYPSYNLIQQIHITDFLDRIDIFILSVWFPVTACEIILIYLAYITGIASLVKQRDYSTLNTPASLLLLLSSLLSFKSITEVFNFSNYSSPVIVLSYQPLLFLLIWLFCFRHPVKQNLPLQSRAGAQEQNKTNKPEQPQPNKQRGGNPNQGLFRGLSLDAWKRCSNILLLISLISICVGLWLGKLYSVAGLAGGITYGVCTVVVVMSSSMELHMSAQHRKL